MTSNRDIIRAIQTLRNQAGCGARTIEQTNSAREALLRRIGAEDVSRPVYTFHDYFDAFTHQFRHSVLRPAMAGFGVLILAAGGWMTSVNAAYESVPGDMLYTVKIATEQAQLSITTSNQKRAELHMEFASRRLAEVTSLNKTDSADKSARMKSTVAAFKNEVAEAKNSMQSLQGSSEAVAVASALDAKATEFSAAIDQAAATLDIASDVGVDVAAAKVDVEQASNDAVEVLVTSAETSTEQGPANEDLQKSFQQNLKALDDQAKLTLGRIAVIEHVVSLGVVVLPPGSDLKFMNSQLQHTGTQSHEAMNTFAIGGYRSAFEQLAEVSAVVDEVESQVVVIELSIIAQQDSSIDLAPVEN